MHNEFTALIEKDEDWYIAYCVEIPGANGQGRTKEECLKSLGEAIELILEDRREDYLSKNVCGGKSISFLLSGVQGVSPCWGLG